MATHRTELNETDEERETRETQETEIEAKEALERQETLDAERAARKEAELKAARAEGEADALRRGLGTTQNQPKEFTEEQWQGLESRTGKTRQQIIDDYNTQTAIADQRLKPFADRLEQSEREAKEAKEEVRQLKARKGTEAVEASFFEKNPALKAHRKDVDEFLATYPDADKVDGATLEKRLKVAADVVKGRVKETMRTNRSGNSGSSRFEGGDEREQSDDLGEFDPKGTGNEGAAHLMSRVHSQFGQGLRHEDSVEVWKKCTDDEGRGVAIGIEEDLAIAREISKKQSIGGKRG